MTLADVFTHTRKCFYKCLDRHKELRQLFTQEKKKTRKKTGLQFISGQPGRRGKSNTVRWLKDVGETKLKATAAAKEHNAKEKWGVTHIVLMSN